MYSSYFNYKLVVSRSYDDQQSVPVLNPFTSYNFTYMYNFINMFFQVFSNVCSSVYIFTLLSHIFFKKMILIVSFAAIIRVVTQ